PEMTDRNAHAADLAAAHLVIGVVARLRGKVERDRETRLPLLEVRLVPRVRDARVPVPRVRPKDARLVALARRHAWSMVAGGASRSGVGKRPASGARGPRGSAELADLEQVGVAVDGPLDVGVAV